MVLLCAAGVLAACTSTEPRRPVPEDIENSAQIPGIPEARFWGYDVSPQLEQELRTLSREELQYGYPALFGQTHNYLAISGGGQDGAFGAGILVGWTEAGDRPSFQMVTGISTGALIGPA